MSLTFKSTTSESVEITIRDSQGYKRAARLERDPSTRKWTGSIDHPSGQRWTVATFGTDAVDALDKLSHALVSREVDYRQSKARGHRPEPKVFDYNQRLPDVGDFAPLVKDGRDSRPLATESIAAAARHNRDKWR